MKIIAIADLHGTLPVLPECDLLLIVGDVCPVSDHNRQYQARWLRGEFNDWLRQIPAQEIVGVGGNHDFVLEDSKKLGYELDWTYLNNESTTVSIHNGTEFESVKVWGSPLSPKFGGWAFMREDKELAAVWETIPEDTDILMVHGPMFGYGDECPSIYNRDVMEHVGSMTLTNRLYYGNFPKLKLFVFGHIHEGYESNLVTRMNNDKPFIWANVSLMNEAYRPVNEPMEFDL